MGKLRRFWPLALLGSVLSGLALTNPDKDAFVSWLAQKAEAAQANQGAGPDSPQMRLLARGIARSFLAANTQRQNFILFSVFVVRDLDDKPTWAAVGVGHSFIPTLTPAQPARPQGGAPAEATAPEAEISWIGRTSHGAAGVLRNTGPAPLVGVRIEGEVFDVERRRGFTTGVNRSPVLAIWDSNGSAAEHRASPVKQPASYDVLGIRGQPKTEATIQPGDEWQFLIGVDDPGFPPDVKVLDQSGRELRITHRLPDY